MSLLYPLRTGDFIEIIAPASRCADKQLADIKALLSSWGLNCIIDKRIFGDDLLCANSDEIRFELLKNALLNPDTKAIICARGGYGSMRLIPKLTTLSQPKAPKLFIGMSDITALHLYFQQQWQWPTIHASVSPDKFSADSLEALQAFLFGKKNKIELTGIPLNSVAQKNNTITAPVIGGNLCLVQTSIGTSWQMHAKNKIILLEEIGERGYRVDRMLEHLQQAKLFDGAAAILFGDFLGGNEPNGSSLIQPVLERFAKTCDIPVVQVTGVGHGPTNFPIPLGIKMELSLGNNIKLNSSVNIEFA